MKNQNYQNISIKVPTDLKKQYQEFCESQFTTVSQSLRQFINQTIKEKTINEN